MARKKPQKSSTRLKEDRTSLGRRDILKEGIQEYDLLINEYQLRLLSHPAQHDHNVAEMLAGWFTQGRRLDRSEILAVQFFEAPEWARPEAAAVARLSIARGPDILCRLIKTTYHPVEVHYDREEGATIRAGKVEQRLSARAFSRREWLPSGGKA